MAISTKFTCLPTIEEVIRQYGLQPNKTFGQNFLLDSSIPDAMLLHAGDLSEQLVVEIGPGPGALTRAILANMPAKLLAIELDPRCINALQPLQHLSDGRLQIICQDAMKLSWQSMLTAPYSIIANLPYNLATPLLMECLQFALQPTQIIVMLQQEVAQRFAALPSTNAYGKLSVLVQARWHAEILFTVPAAEFYPPPKVTSAVIQFTPRAHSISPQQYARLQKICTIAFSQRRKVVRSALRSILPNAAAILQNLGCNEHARAEQLTVADYLKLSALSNE